MRLVHEKGAIQIVVFALLRICVGLGNDSAPSSEAVCCVDFVGVLGRRNSTLDVKAGVGCWVVGTPVEPGNKGIEIDFGPWYSFDGV